MGGKGKTKSLPSHHFRSMKIGLVGVNVDGNILGYV